MRRNSTPSANRVDCALVRGTLRVHPSPNTSRTRAAAWDSQIVDLQMEDVSRLRSVSAAERYASGYT